MEICSPETCSAAWHVLCLNAISGSAESGKPRVAELHIRLSPPSLDMGVAFDKPSTINTPTVTVSVSDLGAVAR